MDNYRLQFVSKRFIFKYLTNKIVYIKHCSAGQFVGICGKIRPAGANNCVSLDYSNWWAKCFKSKTSSMTHHQISAQGTAPQNVATSLSPPRFC